MNDMTSGFWEILDLKEIQESVHRKIMGPGIFRLIRLVDGALGRTCA
jgi:hypothetical protein